MKRRKEEKKMKEKQKGTSLGERQYRKRRIVKEIEKEAGKELQKKGK